MSIYKGNNLIVGPVLNTDVAPDSIPTEGSPRHVMSGGVYDALLTKEDATNKTTVVDASSTDDQYPSAKAAYRALMTCEPANIEYARDLYAPDWSRAAVISSDALLSGYTAPKRGIFIGCTSPRTNHSEEGHIFLNGIPIMYVYSNVTTGNNTIAINTPAAVGDVIRSDVRMMQGGNYNIYFVPYKAQ